MRQYRNEHISPSETPGTHEHKLRNEKMRKYKAAHIFLSELPGTPEHKLRKENMRQYSSRIDQKDKNRVAKRVNNASKNLDKVALFKKEIQHGPYYICVVCNRCLYRRSVILFKEQKYPETDTEFFYYAKVNSFDSNHYICLTCDKKIKKKKVPCQAVCNKLEVFEFPKELKGLKKLEKIIIAKRLLFKKIAIMPKGQAPKLRGAICNVPLDTEDVCNTLPRGADSNGIITVTLKRRLMYRGHVYLKPVRPMFVKAVLQYLKENNHLYEDIDIDESRIPVELTSFTETDEIDMHIAGSSDHEDRENPLDEHRVSASETVLTSILPSDVSDESITIAPCEGKKPLSLIQDYKCEELAHPYLFPTGQFGYKVERYVDISPNKYFNQRLLNYKQKFASESDYIFFAHSVYQQLNMTSRINIALRKVNIK